MAREATRTEPREHSEPPEAREGRGGGEPTLPALGWRGMGRWAWRQLTSMRTALFLLLLLSIAAVPGSIFPQRNIDSGKVADYVAQNPAAAPWLERFGFFDVYASPWFSAIYLLLFISLVGCIVPRASLHYRALRSTPPRAPARLQRLEHHAELTTGLDPLTGIIIGMAVGHLFGWRGDVILPEGQKFASSVSTYNTFSPGPWVDPQEDLPPFVLGLDRLDVQFQDQPGRSFGQPREFTAYATVTGEPGATARQETISVNHPLSLGGADIYLLGNGYTPVITVRNSKGEVLYREATPFLAQDANYGSIGVIKVPSATPKQLGITGFFLPTAEPTFANGPVSLFPDAKNPEVALSIWEGNLFPGGAPQSVYTLNTDEMTQANQGGRLTGARAPEARRDLRDPRWPRFDHVRERQALRGPVGAHRPRGRHRARERAARDRGAHRRTAHQAPPRLRPRAPRRWRGAGGPTGYRGHRRWPLQGLRRRIGGGHRDRARPPRRRTDPP